MDILYLCDTGYWLCAGVSTYRCSRCMCVCVCVCLAQRNEVTSLYVLFMYLMSCTPCVYRRRGGGEWVCYLIFQQKDDKQWKYQLMFTVLCTCQYFKIKEYIICFVLFLHILLKCVSSWTVIVVCMLWSVKRLQMLNIWKYNLVQSIKWWHLCFNCKWSLLKNKIIIYNIIYFI